jgi:hypothetical protein
MQFPKASARLLQRSLDGGPEPFYSDERTSARQIATFASDRRAWSKFPLLTIRNAAGRDSEDVLCDGNSFHWSPDQRAFVGKGDIDRSHRGAARQTLTAI